MIIRVEVNFIIVTKRGHAFYRLAGVHEHNLFNPSLHSLFVHLFVWL
jgi:hypothetical protein